MGESVAETVLLACMPFVDPEAAESGGEPTTPNGGGFLGELCWRSALSFVCEVEGRVLCARVGDALESDPTDPTLAPTAEAYEKGFGRVVAFLSLSLVDDKEPDKWVPLPAEGDEAEGSVGSSGRGRPIGDMPIAKSEASMAAKFARVPGGDRPEVAEAAGLPD